MRRAERLYRITDYLRARRLTTAAWLAARLEVSARTVYRDIADLQRTGIPIRGEAGVGYALAARIDLPPLMFDRQELEALAAGIRFVRAHGDASLGAAAERAQAKIRGAVSRELARRMEEARVLVPVRRAAGTDRLGPLLAAIEARRVLRLDYADAQGRVTARDVWPLAATFGPQAWSLVAWCELRQAFRNFRLDRIRATGDRGRRYPDEPGRRLDDYFREMQERYGVARSEFDHES